MFGRRKVVRKPRKKIRKKFEWEKDADLQERLEEIVRNINFEHIHINRIFCYRTTGSVARAYARIWAFPKIFQQALVVEPAYVIEVLSEKFDRLPYEEQTKVIIHELLHIPKNFSGSLLPHRYGNKTIDREVDRLYRMMKEK